MKLSDRPEDTEGFSSESGLSENISSEIKLPRLQDVDGVRFSQNQEKKKESSAI